MWQTNSLQQLKTQLIKSKSYKSKPKDAQIYMSVFDKYISTIKSNNIASNSQKVIEYFVEIFVSCLHLNPNQKINQMFKKLVYWVNEDRNSRAPYYLVKTVVEICQREFKNQLMCVGSEQIQVQYGGGYNNEYRREKDKDKSKNRQMLQQARSRSNQRQKSRSQQRKYEYQSNNTQRQRQNAKNSIKTILSLVRRAGDRHMLNHDYHPIYRIFVQYYLQRISKKIEELNPNINPNSTPSTTSNNNPPQQSNPTTSSDNINNINLPTSTSTSPSAPSSSSQLCFPILSQLSTLLANRNKPEVGQTIRYHLQKYEEQLSTTANSSSSLSISGYIGVYMLLEFRNIPNLMESVLASRQVDFVGYFRYIEQLAQNYVQDKDIDRQNNKQKDRDPTTSVTDPYKLHSLLTFIIQKLFQIIRSQTKIYNFSILQNLYKLYPFNCQAVQLRNAEQFVDRMYVHLVLHRRCINLHKERDGRDGDKDRDRDEQERDKKKDREIKIWKKWKKQFVSHYREYIESTSIDRDTHQNLILLTNRNIINNDSHTNIKNSFTNIQYVLKQFILNSYLLLQKSHNFNAQQLKLQTQEIVNILKNQYIRNRHNSNKMVDQSQDKLINGSSKHRLQEIQGYFQGLDILVDSCIQVITQYHQSSINKNRNNKFQDRIQYKIFQNINKYAQIQQNCKKQLLALTSETNDDNQGNQNMGTYTRRKDRLINKLTQFIIGKSDYKRQQFISYNDYRDGLSVQNTNTGYLLQNWEILLHVMFQLTKNQCQSQCSHSPTTNQSLNQQYYNKQALYALNCLSIKPGFLHRINRKKYKDGYIICKNTKLSSLCVEILSIVAQKVDREDLISQIKKEMSSAFDRVDQQIIRDIISKDLFLTKCLLMTNHITKCKFLLDLIVRYYQMPKSRNIAQVQLYLQELFVSIPKQVCMDYCKFIISKDKLPFRMALYQKQLTQLDYLCQVNLYDAVIKSVERNGYNKNNLEMQIQ